MHIYTYFINEIQKIIQVLESQGILETASSLDKIVVEPPRDPSHGDMATNVAMVLAKDLRRNPMELGTLLVTHIRQLPHVIQAEVAPPGFINLRLSEDFWLAALKDVLADGRVYGTFDFGHQEVVNVEYVSSNPTGPMHMGHCRGAVVGDVLANILHQVGYKVLREFYVNDAGNQANELARSAYQRYLQALGHEIGEIGSYAGAYLIPVGEKLAKEAGEKYVNQPEESWLESVRAFAVAEMMTQIKQDLADLNIHHDIFTSEKSLIDQRKVQDAVDYLKSLDLIYEGVLEKPKGKEVDDWEPRSQLLFRATQFGDDVDRPLMKSDGTWTYFASDIAYHYDKFRRGAAKMVNIWGADHGGYVKRLSTAVQAITQKKGTVHCILTQMVRFIKEGQVLKMSKRMGNFITVRDGIDAVGLDAIRFMMVSRKNDAGIDFDFAKVVEQSKDNPVFYVQYAYARCHSIQKNMLEQFPGLDLTPATLASLDMAALKVPGFLQVIKKLASWPRLVEQAARAYEPHRITYYMIELAADFHSLWTHGKDDERLRFIHGNSAEKTQVHFALIQGMIFVLESGFALLGIQPRKVM